jgi:hypothetical protein
MCGPSLSSWLPNAMRCGLSWPAAATRWLQRKVWRQAAELDRLNRRVASQRFVLRTLADLGRSLTAEEYRTARDAVGNVELRDRIAADPS